MDISCMIAEPYSVSEGQRWVRTAADNEDHRFCVRLSLPPPSFSAIVSM